MNTAHRWQFFRSGGFDQVALGRAEDLKHLHELDPKLWTALACPTQGLEFDAQTLALLDTNGDGRISAQEVLAAVQTCCRLLRDPSVMFTEGPLTLTALNTDDPEGATLHAAGLRVLARLGKPQALELEVADFADMTRLFAPDQPNGDGVVPAALAAREGLTALVEAILRTQGGVPDRSGAMGITRSQAEAFFEQADALKAWHAQGQADPDVNPLGEATGAALTALRAVQSKVEDFHMRCRLAAFDPAAVGALNPLPQDYDGLTGGTPDATTRALERLPLAFVQPDGGLPMQGAVNPAWAARLDDLRTQAVEPLLGPRDRLSAADWARLGERLGTHAAWWDRRPVTPVGALDLPTLDTLMADGARERLMSLIDEDDASDASAATLEALQRLVHYRRDLVTLLRNFVALSDFYAPPRRAIFQAGTLYLDQRSCDLVLRVSDLEAHARMAPFSHCYLVYCRAERAGLEPQTLVAALTAGSADELMVPGRHGMFVDRAGQEWHATVLRVIEQPVSIRQAFFSPYRRAAAFIENQIRQFAADKDKASETLTQSAATAVTAGVAKPPAAPFDIARFAGIFAAIGLAVGAIGTALSAALAGLFQLAWWQIPLVVAGALLMVSGPSILLAWLKLRRRNLGPLLDANGWAINARVRINLPFGRSLTALASLPSGAQRSARDPYADRRSPWPAWLALTALAALLSWAWHSGWFSRWIGG